MEQLSFGEPAERWLVVPGFEGLYEASDQGRVRGLDRITPNGKRIKGRILKGARDDLGRLKVSLWRHGLQHQHLVHRVVLLAFVGPLPPGQLSRHGPNGVADNSLANLCYGTPRENQLDRVRDHTSLRGEANHWAVLTWEQVREIRRLRKEAGMLQEDLALRFNVTRRTIGRIVNGQTWIEDEAQAA